MQGIIYQWKFQVSVGEVVRFSYEKFLLVQTKLRDTGCHRARTVIIVSLMVHQKYSPLPDEQVF